MTTVISRVFPDKASAKKASQRLEFRGLPARACMIIADVEEDAMWSKMDAARIDDSARQPYAKAIAAGQAVLVVHATYKPLTAATIVRDTLAKLDTVNVGDVVEDFFVPDGPQKAQSVLKDHPLFLTVRASRTGYSGGPVTRGLGFRMTKPHKARHSADAGGGFKSRAFWPMPLLSTKTRKSSVISGDRHMSKAFWPMALLSSKSGSTSVIKGGDLPFSRALGWPPVS